MSANAVVKEDFDLFSEKNGQPRLVVTTAVNDPFFCRSRS